MHGISGGRQTKLGEFKDTCAWCEHCYKQFLQLETYAIVAKQNVLDSLEKALGISSPCILMISSVIDQSTRKKSYVPWHRRNKINLQDTGMLWFFSPFDPLVDPAKGNIFYLLFKKCGLFYIHVYLAKEQFLVIF